MPSFYLPYANSRFHGIREGNGAHLLICLHGFGESAAHFALLTEGLGARFTIVALDMPLHGRTEWKEEREFTRADLKAVIQMVMQQEQQQRYSLLGYSMGGRLALCMVEEMAVQLQYVVLLAADGIKNNPWHLFATQTSLGNRLFKYVAYHPQVFFALLSSWHKLGLLNESVHKFAFNSMNQQEKRLLVYHVWTCMRRMMPDLKLCRQLLARHRIYALLIYGKYDRIIPHTLGTRLVDGSFPGEILVLEKGHQLLSAELGHVINQHLV